jgi:hypothetical protein
MAHNDLIQLDIASPKGVYEGTFRETDKVETVIQAVVAKQQLDAGDQFELVFQEHKLEPVQRTLESFHLPNDAKLELVATGSGV